ncbi:MAG: CcmD family protein [Ginsengibacter sp.]
MIKSYFKRLFLTVSTFFLSSLLWAQTASDSVPVTSDTVMRSNDKIYVVMAVCLTILVVLFMYLIRIDIKVSKKEKLV